MDNNYISVEWFDQGIEFRLSSYENMLIGSMKLQMAKGPVYRHEDSILDLHLGYCQALRELGCLTEEKYRNRLKSFRQRAEAELSYIESLKRQLEEDEDDCDEDRYYDEQ